MNLSRRSFLAASSIAAAARPALENSRLRLEFDSRTGTLTGFQNKLTGESCSISGDEFAVEAREFQVEFPEFQLESATFVLGAFKAIYRHRQVRVEVAYTLGRDHAFAEKRVVLTPARACGLTRVVLSRPEFSAPGIEILCYQHPTFERLEAQHHNRIRRPPGTNPVRTYFGRTSKGGFYTGVEMPFDNSTQQGRRLTLSYAPNLKLKAAERFECEPLYLGVYRRATAETGLPLPSESDAMVAMTSAILGPRRYQNVAALACGWGSEFEQFTWPTEEAVTADIHSLDVLAECGVDWFTDSHPWAGQFAELNAFTGEQTFQLGTRARRFLEHARKLGIKVVQWPTMNSTHPWSREEGRPFRPDKPEWLRVPPSPTGARRLDQLRNIKANCLANTPFFDWLLRLDFQVLATGYYDAWCMDGDFWGGGGYFDTTVPVECASDQHDHLPRDANYACQRALDRWIAAVRRRYPKIFVAMCRPPMDLGVWSQRNVDAAFTLIETGTGLDNIQGGDEIRTASRIRVHQHFFPHYLDWPLLFPSYSAAPPKDGKPRQWPSAKLDYILLSALSSAPNLLLYLPTKTGLPARDKAEIRKWLEWGRKNFAYLNVRRDLADWPAAGKVDGSAHMLGDRGIVFLFNPNQQPLPAEFALTPEGIGCTGRGRYHILQEYPAPAHAAVCRGGETVRWEVPGRSVALLRISR